MRKTLAYIRMAVMRCCNKSCICGLGGSTPVYNTYINDPPANIVRLFGHHFYSHNGT